MSWNNRFSGIEVELVSMNSKAYSTEQLFKIKETLEPHGIGLSDVHRLNNQYLEDLVGGGRNRFLVLLDNWKRASDLCKNYGLVPEGDYTPLWLLSLTVDGFMWYNPLVKHPDFTNRIVYLKETKKIAGIFGNCQARPITQLLRQSDEFMRDYWLVLFSLVQFAGKDVYANGFDERFLKSLDLFMTMTVKPTNKFSEKVSTEYTRSKLSESCHVVILPNIYFSGYFPQINYKDGQVPRSNLLEARPPTLAARDRYVEDAIVGAGEIGGPTDEEILDNLDKTTSELLSREKDWDVRISDYILSNYKTHRIFHTSNHPITEVLGEEVKRLLDFLGYLEPDLSEEGVVKLDDVNGRIYPEVYRVLGLEFSEGGGVWINRHISTESFDEATYLSLLRMFKTREWWDSSVRWINRPLNKSLRLDISFPEFVEVKSEALDFTDSAVHLALTVIVKYVPGNAVIATLPQCVAPSRPFVTPGMCSGKTVKLTVQPSGCIEQDVANEGTVEMRVETTWLY